MIITRRSLLLALGLALPAAAATNAASATTAIHKAHKHSTHSRVAHSRRHGKSHHLAASGHTHGKHA